MPSKETPSVLLSRRNSPITPQILSSGLVLLFALLSGFLSASASDFAFPQHLVNDDLMGEEFRYDPAAIPLADGNTLLLWIDNSSGRTDIVSRIIGEDLQGQGEPSRIIDDDGFWYQRDVIASAPNGGRAVAVWFDERGGDGDLYAQVFSAETGTLVGGNLHLNMDAGFGIQDAPAVAVSSTGRALVAWMDNRTGRYRIWGRFIEPDGTMAGDDFQIATEDPQRIQRQPGLGALPDGRWLVAYEVNIVSDLYQVFYRIIEADGQAQEPGRMAENTGNNQEEPVVAVRSQDALVAWIDNREGTSDMWGIWFDHDGEPLGPSILLRQNGDTPRDINPRLYAGADDVVALSWLGAVQQSERTMLRFFGADRTPISGDLVMNDPASEILSRQGVVVQRSPGNWLLSWADNRTLSQQVYLDTAHPVHGPAGNVVQAYASPGSASQMFPDVALFPDRRAVVVWADIRSGSLNIFCRFLDNEGTPEGSSFLVNAIPVLQRIGAVEDVLRLSRFAPSVAASDSSFVVTWPIDAGGGSLVLYAQIFDLEGQPIGSNFPIVGSANPDWPQADPSPAMAPDGRFAIAWRDNRVDNGGDIMLQMFGPSGERVGQSIHVVTPGGPRAMPQQSPSLAASRSDLVVAWADRRGRGWDVWRQRLPLNNPEGVPISNEILHEPGDASNDNLYPTTATNGEAIATVWEHRPLASGEIRGRLEFFPSKRMGNTPGRGFTWDAQTGADRSVHEPAIGHSSGVEPVPQGSADDGPVSFVVNRGATAKGFKRPRVSIDNAGRFLVTWWDIRDGRTAIWAQRYDKSGTPMEGPYEIDEHTAQGFRTFPRLDLDQEVIQFVWSDSRRSLGWDIYARRVDWDYSGTPVPIMLNYFVAETTQDGPSIRWSVSSDVSGLQFLVWRDLAYSGEPGPAPSPEAVLVTPAPVDPSQDGRFEFVDRGAPSGLPLLYYLEVAYPSEPTEFYGPVAARWDAQLAEKSWKISPNPFRDRLELYPPSAGFVVLDVWDVTGRKVRNSTVTADPGAPLVWDGFDDAGRQVPAGIYFVRPGRPAGAPSSEMTAGGSTSTESVSASSGPVFKVLRVR